MKRLFLLFLAVSTGLSATLLDRFRPTLGLGYNSDIPTPSNIVQYSKTSRTMQQDTNEIISDEAVINFCAKINIPSSTVEHIKHVISNCKNKTQFIEYLETLNDDELLNLINAINYLNITINSVINNLNKLLRYLYTQRTEVFAKLSQDLKDYFYENKLTNARFWLKEGHTYTPNKTLDHTSVCGAQFSSDNKLVVTASNNNTAKIWDAATGQCLQTLQHNEGVNSAQFSSDNKLVVTASSDRTAKVWDAATGQCLQTLQHSNLIRSAQFSSDNNLVVTASGDHTAKVWDAATGQCLQTLHTCTNKASFSQDNKFVITEEHHTVKVWNITTGQCLQTLQHNGFVRSAQFSSDNKLVLTASGDDCAAKIWDAATGQCLQTLQHNDYVSNARFSSDNRLIITVSGGNIAKVWTLVKPAEDSTVPAIQPLTLRNDLIPILIGGTAIAAATLLGYCLNK